MSICGSDPSIIAHLKVPSLPDPRHGAHGDDGDDGHQGHAGGVGQPAHGAEQAGA